MDHPNIAKVLDAGATGTGRPYFVMELVRGIKITDYCDQNVFPPKNVSTFSRRSARPCSIAHQKGYHSPRHQTVEYSCHRQRTRRDWLSQGH